jgi:hypothetical protein
MSLITEKVQIELEIVASPFVKKINFLTTRISSTTDPKSIQQLNELLAQVRKESFVACYDHFKNKIDQRIETPIIDYIDEEEYIKQLDNIITLYAQIEK